MAAAELFLHELELLLEHELVGQLLVDPRRHHRRPTNVRLVHVVLAILKLARRGRLVGHGQVGAAVELGVVLLDGMGWAARPLDALALLAGVVGGAGGAEVGTRLVGLISKNGLPLGMAVDPLALGLGLPDAELLGDEAVLDDLVDVLLLREGPLVVEVEVAHLLADIGLVDGLRVVPDEAVVSQALSDEGPIDTGRVARGGALLMASGLDLVLVQQNSLPMYLLEGNVRRRQVVVVDGVLVEGVHWRVGVRAALVERPLRHHPMPILLLAVSVRPIIRSDLEVRRLTVGPLAVAFIAERVSFARGDISDEARVHLLIEATVEF